MATPRLYKRAKTAAVKKLDLFFASEFKALNTNAEEFFEKYLNNTPVDLQGINKVVFVCDPILSRRPYKINFATQRNDVIIDSELISIIKNFAKDKTQGNVTG